MQACIRFPLGKQGENEAVRVVWPGIVEKFRKLYGNGAFTLTAKRCGDAAAYPVAVSTEGGDVVWLVRAADVASPGSGSCELTYTVDGAVAKSQTWSTYVAASISGDAPGEPPEDPSKAWFAAIQAQIGNLDDLTTKAKASLVAAINEAARTGSGGAGSISMRTADGYIQYSTDSGDTWVNLIALADLKGAPGKDGTDGANGITPTIGDNGNWYLGTVDTGKPSRGAKGENGDTGADGKDGAGMDITGATVGQIAKISAVDTDGKPTAWEPADLPNGGSGAKAWTKIIDADVTETTGSFRADGLANVTEFDILWSNLQNASTLDSGLSVIINNIAVAGNNSVIVGKSGSSKYGWTRLTYDGLFWHVQKSAGAIATNNLAVGSTIYATYNLIRDVGAATTFVLDAPTLSYAPASGKLEVWAR